VRFVSHLSSPFEIKQVTTNIPQYIEVTLKPEVAGKIYLLEVKNKRQEPGHYAGKIELTTNDRKKPRLFVRVFADLAPSPAAKP
jgi:hypothetical protein